MVGTWRHLPTRALTCHNTIKHYSNVNSLRTKTNIFWLGWFRFRQGFIFCRSISNAIFMAAFHKILQTSYWPNDHRFFLSDPSHSVVENVYYCHGDLTTYCMQSVMPIMYHIKPYFRNTMTWFWFLRTSALILGFRFWHRRGDLALTSKHPQILSWRHYL